MRLTVDNIVVVNVHIVVSVRTTLLVHETDGVQQFALNGSRRLETCFGKVNFLVFILPANRAKARGAIEIKYKLFFQVKQETLQF